MDKTRSSSFFLMIKFAGKIDSTCPCVSDSGVFVQVVGIIVCNGWK